MKVSFAFFISLLMPVVITARLSGNNAVNVEGGAYHQQDDYSNSNKELFVVDEADHYHDLHYQQQLDERHLDSCSELGQFNLELTTGIFGNVISWELKELNDIIAIREPHSRNGDFVYPDSGSYCLQEGVCYSFTIRDKFPQPCYEMGHGIYKGILDGMEVFGGGLYGQEDTREFCVPSPRESPSVSPSASPSESPSFESISHKVCENYAVHARTTVTFGGALSTIHHGDVSVSPGTSITGAFAIDVGEVVVNSADFAASVLGAHHDAMAKSGAGVISIGIEIGGFTFTPGTYRSDSAINFAHGTVVTLDGVNAPNPEFLFIAGSTLVTAADTSFNLINGARAENVLWALGTAATLGARSVVEGSIMAGTAITFGTNSELHGCALAQSAVTFESEGSVCVPSPNESPSVSHSASPSESPSFESISHEVCENYAVHARTTVTFGGALSTIHHGDVSVSPGTSITGAFAIDVGEVVGNSADFAASVLGAHHDAMAKSGAGVISIGIEIGGFTFTPGTYRSDSAINFAHGTVVTLDGVNAPNPEFLFIAGSTLVTAADTSFNLINGARAENVLWALGTAATLGARSVVEGSIMAGTAITFGTNSELHGCALAQSAVTFESEGSVVLNHYEADGIFNVISI